MKSAGKVFIAAFLLTICIIIRLYSLNPIRVENGYSNTFFPHLASILRYGFGFIPFSVGDILYGLLAVWLVWKFTRVFLYIYRSNKMGWSNARFKRRAYRLFVTFSFIYIIFNIFWGVNYNRKGISWQLGLPETIYSIADLQEINCLLIAKINESKLALITHKNTYPGNALLFKKISASFKMLEAQYPFLQYSPPSLKSSMWGWLGNYTGFTGYYNPFTGEAQLNTTIPKFIQPFTACHEVAHQLGYAKEKEANFVGFLAARASADTLLHYSVYLNLFSYANRNLFFRDSLSARLYRKELLPGVVADIKEWADFNRRHTGPLEPVVSWLYGKYLQSNEQPSGIKSYDEVTGFIIAYYKKFGKI